MDIKSIGKFGVCLFFVHTALVLMMSMDRQLSEERPERFFWNFYIRRFFRIYPLAIVAILTTYFLKIPVAHLDTFTIEPVADRGLSTLLANLALVQNISRSPNIIGPLWSLPWEVQMYFVLPFFFLFVRKISGHILPGVLFLSLVGMSAVWMVWKGCSTPLYVEFFTFMPCFLPGIIGFVLWKNEKPFFPFFFFVIFLGILGVVHGFLASPRYYFFEMLCTGFLLPFIKDPTSTFFGKIFSWVAKYSYGLYLFHMWAMWAAFELAKSFPYIVQGIVCVLILTGCPIFFYHVIEEPMIQWGKNWTKKIKFSDDLGRLSSERC